MVGPQLSSQNDCGLRLYYWSASSVSDATPGGGSLNSSPAAAASSRRSFHSSHFCCTSAAASARPLTTPAFSAALICLWRRFSSVSSSQDAITMVVPQLSIITKEKAADVIAIGAIPCHTNKTFSATVGRVSSAIAVRIIQDAAMITWTVKRPKYHRLYLAGMLQIDSLSSLDRSPCLSSSGGRGPAS